MFEFSLKWGTDYYLREKAQIPVRIGQLFINPATSRVSLSLAGEKPGQELRLDLGAVRFDWWTVFLKRLRLGHIAIKGLRLEIERDAAGRIKIGGIRLPSQAAPVSAKAEVPPPASTHPWGIGVGQVDIQDVHVDYQDPGVKASVVIRHFHMDPAESWRADAQTPFDADLELNGGRLLLSGTCRPFRSAPTLSARLQVSELPFAWLAPLLKHPGFDGNLSGTFILDGLEVSPSSGPAAVRLRRLEVAGGRLKLVDHSLHPTFRWTIGSWNLKVAGIDTSDSESVSDYQLAARLTRYETIDLRGHWSPFAAAPDGRVEFKVDGLDLTPFTPFAEELVGYRLATGLMDFKTDADVKDGHLAASNHLVAHKFHLQKLKADELDPSAKQIGLPLNLCLALLRDADDNIRLDVPLEGDLRDPKTPVGRLVWQLLGKALTAALRAAATAFFPSGTKLGFDPIVFAAGQAQLQPEAQTYLGKVGEKLAQRPEAALKLFGWAAGADWYALKGKRAPKTPEVLDLAGLSSSDKDKLLALAAARVQTIRGYLADTYHIDPKRLPDAAPQIDPTAAGAARAELSL